MNPSPRPPFDQGLFLTHFNKGKDLYDHKRFEDAERELEEAYLLRPRDQKVLNLLGLVYFKQEKYEKAEEVYRKLVAESPEAHTLFYNLGLIYFKLNRLEEAESAFLKALELSQDNPKINFYLGSIYERQHRFQDAIFQYRQAGANIMVRRVEDKIAAGAKPAAPASAPPPRNKKAEDTAEFKTSEIREQLIRGADPREKTEPVLIPGKTLRPVSDMLMADNAPRHDTTQTARLRTAETLPPAGAGSVRFPEIINFPQRGGAEAQVPAIRRSESLFRFLENNLMEVNFSGKVFIKQGTIYSYSGNLTFWVKDKRPGGQTALVIITGTGRVILTDKEREITFMHVEDETVYVAPLHLLACEDTLAPRYAPLAAGSGLEFLILEGRGMVALSASSKPLALTVTPDMPASVPSASVIAWSGALAPRLIEDRQLYEVILSPGSPAGSLIRLEGTGRILVEQAAG
jgi:uncharacterized protein (AIM24 family)/Tfp pilus assembly protein PilF